MISKNQIFTVILSAILTIILILSISEKYPINNANSGKSGSKYPVLRAEWEKMRLKDPNTGKVPEKIKSKVQNFVREMSVKPAFFTKKSDCQSLKWNDRGPIDIGGRIRAFAADVNNEANLLAGGVSSGMWRSTNGGTSWEKTTGENDALSISTLVQDIRDGKTETWYLGTGEVTGSARKSGLSGNGIYKSTDNGASWSKLESTSTESSGSDFEFVTGIVIDPSNMNEDEIYCSTLTGKIFRSIDGGENWIKVYGSEQNSDIFTEIAISPSGNAIYVTLADSFATDRGVRRSTDGINWANITPQEWYYTMGRTVIGIAPSNENTVYFLESSAPYFPGNRLWKYTYISGDGTGGGGKWENLSDNIPNGNNTIANLNAKRIFSSQGGYDLLVAVKPDNENTVFIGGVNLYRSTDGFSSGNNISYIGGEINISPNTSLTHHADQHKLVFSNQNPDIVFSTHDGGLSKTENITDNIVVWQSLNSNMKTTQYYSVAIDHSISSDRTLIGGTQDNGTLFSNSTEGPFKWSKVGGGDGGFCAIADGKSHYYISSQNGIVSRISIDGNGNSTGPAVGMFPLLAPGSQLFINPFILNPADQNMMFYAGGKYIYRNSNITNPPPSYDYWTRLDQSVISRGKISALEVSYNPENILYYGTTQGEVCKMENAGSENPSVLNLTPEKFPGGYVSSIAVDRENADNVLITFSNYGIPSLFFSSDGGAEWTNVSGNLEEDPDGTGAGPSVRCAEIVNYKGVMYYFAGSCEGLFKTRELNGASTVWAGEGQTIIENNIVEMIDSRDADGFLAVATHGSGVFTANVDVLSSIDITDTEIISASVKVLQNFPNPFNRYTKIFFNNPKPVHIKISIYDISGRLVKVLTNDYYEKGQQSVFWDGRNGLNIPVSSGIYFCTVRTPDFSKTMKMAYVK